MYFEDLLSLIEGESYSLATILYGEGGPCFFWDKAHFYPFLCYKKWTFQKIRVVSGPSFQRSHVPRVSEHEDYWGRTIFFLMELYFNKESHRGPGANLCRLGDFPRGDPYLQILAGRDQY